MIINSQAVWVFQKKVEKSLKDCHKIEKKNYVSRQKEYFTNFEFLDVTQFFFQMFGFETYFKLLSLF